MRQPSDIFRILLFCLGQTQTSTFHCPAIRTANVRNVTVQEMTESPLQHSPFRYALGSLPPTFGSRSPSRVICADSGNFNSKIPTFIANCCIHCTLTKYISVFFSLFLIRHHCLYKPTACSATLPCVVMDRCLVSCYTRLY